MRVRKERDYAYRCLPVFLRVRELQGSFETNARRLLRILFLWHREMPSTARGLLSIVSETTRMTNVPIKEHWNRVYSTRGVQKLGWYEATPQPSIRLIYQCPIKKDDPILDVGVGASTLIDYLIDRGYKNITALDISDEAIKKLRARLGEQRNRLVRWIVDDVTEPAHLEGLKNNIVLWHDRALLHFLIEEDQKLGYLKALNLVLQKGGYVVIAAFSLMGAKKCSGLDVQNYDQDTLPQFLGDNFILLDYFDYTYLMPSGEPRPYIYTLFQKVS